MSVYGPSGNMNVKKIRVVIVIVRDMIVSECRTSPLCTLINGKTNVRRKAVPVLVIQH